MTVNNHDPRGLNIAMNIPLANWNVGVFERSLVLLQFASFFFCGMPPVSRYAFVLVPAFAFLDLILFSPLVESVRTRVWFRIGILLLCIIIGCIPLILASRYYKIRVTEGGGGVSQTEKIENSHSPDAEEQDQSR